MFSQLCACLHWSSQYLIKSLLGGILISSLNIAFAGFFFPLRLSENEITLIFYFNITRYTFQKAELNFESLWTDLVAKAANTYG